MSWLNYLVTNHALPSSANPDRWLSHLTDKGISCFSLISARSALREYHRRFKNNFSQPLIQDQHVYEDVLSKFNEQIQIASDAEHETDAHRAIRDMRDYYNANIDHIVRLRSRHIVEAAMWGEEEQGVIDRALAAEAEAAERRTKESRENLGGASWRLGEEDEKGNEENASKGGRSEGESGEENDGDGEDSEETLKKHMFVEEAEAEGYDSA